MVRAKSQTIVPLRLVLVLVVLVAAFLVQLHAPARAAASHPLTTSVADGLPVLDQNAPLADRRIHAAGARSVRLSVNWNLVAPGGSTRPSGFDASNPADPHYDWSLIDNGVRAAVANHLAPVLMVLYAPRWAERSSGGPAGTNSPDPGELGQFARALARRYNGHFGGLPRVTRYMAWLEPNYNQFLSPQYVGASYDTASQLVSPDQYRGMLNAFAGAVHGVDGRNLVIGGNPTSFTLDGPPNRGIGPMPFMRRLLCLSGGRHPRPTCSARADLDVWGFNPYTAGGPRHHAGRPEDVSLGDLSRMNRVLRAARRYGKIRTTHRRVQFWAMEFGWDSRPPDPGGLPLRLEARWTSEALYVMWRSGISYVTWFLLRDSPRGGAPWGSTYQTGLYFRCSAGLRCDRPKPELGAFRFPFVAYRRAHQRVYVWGRTPGGRRATVSIQQKVHGHWRRLRRLHTNRYGIFSRAIRRRGGGSLRARLKRRGGRSRAFSLHRPADRDVQPFG